MSQTQGLALALEPVPGVDLVEAVWIIPLLSPTASHQAVPPTAPTFSLNTSNIPPTTLILLFSVNAFSLYF